MNKILFLSEYTLNAAVIIIGIPFSEDFQNQDSNAYTTLVSAFLQQVRASRCLLYQYNVTSLYITQLSALTEYL